MSTLALARPQAACRLCNSTVDQKRFGREWLWGLGQWLVRCGTCAGAYLDPDLTEDSLARFYAVDYRRLYTAEAAHRYDAQFLADIRVREVGAWRAARLAGSIPEGGAVLEIGSGYGGFLGQLHAARPDIQLTAVEPDAVHCAAALDSAPVHFADRLEELTGPFDLIALFHTVEHLADPQAALMQLRSFLAPGGRIALEVPDAAAPWSGWQDVHAAHLSYFTGPSLDRLCTRSGLAPLASRAPLPDTLWRELAPASPSSPAPAPASEIAELDRHIAQYVGRPRDRIKRYLKTIAVAVLGPERVGARQRRRSGPAIDRALGNNRVRLFGLPVDALTMDEVLARAEWAMRDRMPLRHTDLNVAKLVGSQDEPALRDDIFSSDLVTADGMGIYLAAKLLGTPLPERLAGIDIMEQLLARCAEHGFRPYILGARADILEAGIVRLKQRHSALDFAGWHHGYFPAAEETALVERIAAARPDCLFVAMPSPAKEAFLVRHQDRLKMPFAMGVGGSIDVIAGLRWRAPLWMQRAGLEWVARMVQEPRRLGPRYLTTNTRFAWLLLRKLVGGR